MEQPKNMQSKRPAPQNILESIFYGVEFVNENVVILSQNLEETMNRLVEMRKEVDNIKRFFNQPAPTEPNASGEGSVFTE